MRKAKDATRKTREVSVLYKRLHIASVELCLTLLKLGKRLYKVAYPREVNSFPVLRLITFHSISPTQG